MRDGTDERMWTFRGHWDGDRIVVTDTWADGEGEPPRRDPVTPGDWVANGWGVTVEEAERDARSEYTEGQRETCDDLGGYTSTNPRHQCPDPRGHRTCAECGNCAACGGTR